MSKLAKLKRYTVDVEQLIQQAAQAIPCEEEMVEAFYEVESRREPFDKLGNPTHLQERHITGREFVRRGHDLAVIHSKFPHIRQWVSLTPYGRGGYGRYAKQIEKFKAVASLNFPDARDVAICGGSWGSMQVLGSHWQSLGYENPEAFYEAMETLEGQFDCFVRYIKANHLAKAMQQRDWHKLARGYNGKNYAKYGYHEKLAKAYTRAINKRAPKKAISKSKTSNGIAVATGGSTFGVGWAVTEFVDLSKGLWAGITQAFEAMPDWALVLLGCQVLVLIGLGLATYAFLKDQGRI